MQKIGFKLFRITVFTLKFKSKIHDIYHKSSYRKAFIKTASGRKVDEKTTNIEITLMWTKKCRTFHGLPMTSIRSLSAIALRMAIRFCSSSEFATGAGDGLPTIRKTLHSTGLAGIGSMTPEPILGNTAETKKSIVWYSASTTCRSHYPEIIHELSA